ERCLTGSRSKVCAFATPCSFASRLTEPSFALRLPGFSRFRTLSNCGFMPSSTVPVGTATSQYPQKARWRFEAALLLRPRDGGHSCLTRPKITLEVDGPGNGP